MPKTTTHHLTLRLPDSLYRQVKRLAARRKVSMNRLTQESLDGLARRAEEQELAAAYEQLASDPEETDVERFREAQAEVIGRDRR